MLIQERIKVENIPESSDYRYTEKRNKDVDFEIDKKYQRIGKELAIDTKNILMLGGLK